jgi:CheY-like chemotaxis protein
MAISASLLRPQFFSRAPVGTNTSRPEPVSRLTARRSSLPVSSSLAIAAELRSQRRRNSADVKASGATLQVLPRFSGPPASVRTGRRDGLSAMSAAAVSSGSYGDDGAGVGRWASVETMGDAAGAGSAALLPVPLPVPAVTVMPPPAAASAAPAIPAAPVPAAPAAAAVVPPAGPLSGVVVLAVDDTRTSRFITTRMLKRLGAAAVEEAETGMEAKAAYGSRRFDAILLDMHLPDMTGIEVAHSIRAVEAARGLRHCAIIALSGDADLADECTRGGLMDAFLLKPASQEQIQRAVSDAVARRRRQ